MKFGNELSFSGTTVKFGTSYKAIRYLQAPKKRLASKVASTQSKAKRGFALRIDPRTRLGLFGNPVLTMPHQTVRGSGLTAGQITGTNTNAEVDKMWPDSKSGQPSAN